MALNAADEEHAPLLVKAENYTFYAWTIRGTLPSWEGPIKTFSSRLRYRDEVPFQEALAWARENNGTEKSVIQADIEDRLKK
jgi:hypothetical protein